MDKKNVRIEFISLFYIMAAVFVISAVTNAGEINKAYWTDASGDVRLDQVNLAKGQERVIRLKAEVPMGKTLKAYSLNVSYDATVISVKAAAAPESLIVPVNINNDNSDIIIVNGFDVNGVKGEVALAIVGVTVKGLAEGSCDLTVSFSAFGSSGKDQFLPAADIMRVILAV